jgi:hypothetical protein
LAAIAPYTASLDSATAIPAVEPGARPDGRNPLGRQGTCLRFGACGPAAGPPFACARSA